MPRRRAVPAALAAAIAALVIPSLLAQGTDTPADEVSRRVTRWQSEPALRPFTEGVPTDSNANQNQNTGPAPGEAKTKIALCFGVNRTDPAFYGSENPLDACENDASDLAALGQRLGFRTKLFRTRDATTATLFRELQAAAAELQRNDCLIVTYSGHGSTVPDENGDEYPSREDQAWCMHDRFLVDDELYQQWFAFREGVRIYVIADSCHSGTSTRAIARGQNPRSRSPGAAALANLGGVAAGGGKARTISRQARDAAVAIQQPRYGQIWRRAQGNDTTAREMRASGLLLAGCQDLESSFERGRNGAFTAAILRIVGSGHFLGTYRDLITQATSAVNDPNQHPHLFQFGALTENTETARPFGN